MLESLKAGGVQRSLVRGLVSAAIALQLGSALGGEIVVGQVAPLSGPEGAQGQAYAAGMELYFETINARGGVNGNTFALQKRDDRGDANQTLAETQALVSEGVSVLAGYFGSKNIAGVVASGLLTKDKIAIVGVRASEVIPDRPYVFSVRAGLGQEIQKIIQHLGALGVVRLALLHETGPGAQGVIASAEEAALASGSKLGGRASYDAGTTQVSAAVDSLLKSDAQAVLMICSGSAAASFIEQYRKRGGTAQLYASSSADIVQLSRRLGESQLQGVAIAQVVPSPYKLTSQISKELNETLASARANGAQASYSVMEGYITAKLIVEAARRAGAKPNRESIVQALERLDSLDLGGYLVGFKGGSKTGSKFVELSIVAGGKVRQ